MTSSNTPEQTPNLNISIATQLILINLLWGGSSVAAKSALTQFPPFTLAALRFLPIGLALLAWLRFRNALPQVPRRDLWSLALMAFGGIFLSYSLFFMGVERTSASDASLLVACEPLFIALCAHLFLRERLQPRQWFGLILGVAGVGFIAGQAWGNVLALIAVCCEGSVSILGKRLTATYSGTFILGAQMTLGALMLTPFAFVEMRERAPVWTPEAVSGLLFLMFVCSALCYGVWYRCMAKCPVSLMGAFLLVQPLSGPVYGWLLRGETLSGRSLVGGLLIVTGIAFTILQRRSAQKAL